MCAQTHTHTHTHTHVFKIQSCSDFKVRVEMKKVWMSLDYESSGQAEVDELRPVTGDKGIQKCVIAWLHWKLLEAYRYFSHFVCDTSAFTPSVPNVTVLLQSEHCASDSLLSTAFNQLNCSCSWSKFRSQSLSRTGEVCGDKFRPGCWQNATCVPDTSDRSTTQGADCETHQQISPKQKQKN